jgi:hypothetical protein
MITRQRWATVVTLVVLLAPAIDARIAQPPDDPAATLGRTRARMYRLRSADVWRAVPDALKSASVVFPKINAASQFATAWSIEPMTRPRERRSELRVFVSPYAEPARVYVSSIMRDPDPGDSRNDIVRYNAGELESAFFTALEKAIGQPGEPIPMAAPARAALAHRLLGAAADTDVCLKRLEDDEPLGMNPDGGVMAPQKIKDSDAIPVYAGGKPRDRNAGQPRIDATITEDGALIPVRLIQTGTTEAAFTAAVLGAASLWHYEPVKIDGCNVPVRLTLAVEPARR